MTCSTSEAAAQAGCGPLAAGRIGRKMLGRPDGEPLWTEADVRHLLAAITLRNDSPPNFYSATELARITRPARFNFIHYLVISERAGVGTIKVERALEIAACAGVHRIMCLDAIRPRVVIAA